MARSKYRIIEKGYPCFVTSTFVHALPLFSNKLAALLFLNALKYHRQQSGLKIHASLTPGQRSQSFSTPNIVFPTRACSRKFPSRKDTFIPYRKLLIHRATTNMSFTWAHSLQLGDNKKPICNSMKIEERIKVACSIFVKQACLHMHI